MGDLVFLDLDPYPARRLGEARRLAIDDRIMLPVDRAWKLVKLRAIELIYAAGDYSEVHLFDSTQLVTLRSLRCWEQCLPARQFVRVHRSAIVNADAIEQLEEWFNSSFRIHLRNRSEPLISSRRYAAQLRARFR